MTSLTPEQRGRLMSPEQVADALNMPVESLRSWRRRGLGPRWARIGKHIRYRAGDVEDWINETFDKAEKRGARH